MDRSRPCHKINNLSFCFDGITKFDKGESLFIGITLWAVLGKSFKSGCASVADYSGGIMAERIRTRALIPPIIKFRIIESFASTIGAALVLAVYFGVDLLE